MGMSHDSLFTIAIRQFASLGGKARAKKLSKKRRREIAKQAGIASGNARRAKACEKAKKELASKAGAA